jgi:hypothetical protein
VKRALLGIPESRDASLEQVIRQALQGLSAPKSDAQGLGRRGGR